MVKAVQNIARKKLSSILQVTTKLRVNNRTKLLQTFFFFSIFCQTINKIHGKRNLKLAIETK